MDGFTFPDSPGAIFVWLIALAVIIGLYLLVRRTHRRSEEAHRTRRRAEHEARAKDPDMRKPDAGA